MVKKKKINSELRSGLEDYCKKQLLLHKLPLHYEAVKIPLLPSFEYDGECGEKIGKVYKKQRAKIQDMVYTPDFVSSPILQDITGVIETKGLIRPKDRVVWKLFKYGLKENNKSGKLYKPSNQEEVDETIKLIKNEICPKS